MNNGFTTYEGDFVSIVACMDQEKYISNFANADFTIADASVMNSTTFESVCDGVGLQDIQALAISTFLVIGGALSVILALIAILNFINLTYTSIHERKQELKVLGAIGMTKKQIAAMLSYEGIFRVLLTFALVLTIGQLLNYVIVYLMAGEMIMFSYKYVVWPMFACIPVFLVIAAAIPRMIGNSKKLLLKR